METGIVETREEEIKISVFATCNDPRKLSATLQSRFFIVDLQPYTYEQFYQIIMHVLDTKPEIARIIAETVWDTSGNFRDCMRIGKPARSEEDVMFLVGIFLANKRIYKEI